MTIGQRINLLRKQLKANQKDFADRLSIDQGYVSQLENDKYIPSPALKKLISALFNVSIEWLESGVGNMFPATVAAQPVETAPIDEPLFEERHGADRAVCIKYFPAVKAAAGYGAHVDNESSEDYFVDYTVVRSKNYDVVINVIGDSMEPTLFEGDKILINMNNENLYQLIPNYIYVISQGDDVYIKRFVKHKGSVGTFKSDNKKYGIITVDFSDESNRIVGVLRGLVYRRIQPDIEERLAGETIQ